MGSDTSEGTGAHIAQPHDAWSAPTRARVFGELWWRSLALTAAGGGVIGFCVGPLFIIDWGGSRDTVQAAIVAAPFGAGVGAAMGVMLGILIGVVMGAVGAIWLVPYRGEVRTRGSLRLTALISVGAWTTLFHDQSALIFVAIAAPSLVGAWWMSPWVGSWYCNWMSESPPFPGPARAATP